MPQHTHTPTHPHTYAHVRYMAFQEMALSPSSGSREGHLLRVACSLSHGAEADELGAINKDCKLQWE
jgi:hypothetical protein